MEEEEEVPGHHDDGSMQISMEGVEFPQLYEHPLITSIRFAFTRCMGLLNYDGTQEEEEEEVPQLHYNPSISFTRFAFGWILEALKRRAMNFGRKQSSMERVELPQLHMHPLIPFTHFAFKGCQVCSPYVSEFNVNTYGGYRCNELGCEEAVFHKYCANPLKEINHSFHPDHPLKLIIPTFPLYDS
ncbi:hypothetical protein DY000_02020317 [Brassica cretica]|uniref:DC1 domain-containing protein n=1 Tax=Brassica cretica TaxID=69181 RepID=A0ABQ7E4E2_BRACR|nr:hypothetical protein DY000_02020317 [Brassica cretica]